MSIKRDRQTDELFRSMLHLTSIDECYAYFEDLCTVKEIRDMGQRLEVARLMDAGSSYQNAQQATGASSATIGRVKKCLDYGAGGYRLILDRLSAGETEEQDEA